MHESVHAPFDASDPEIRWFSDNPQRLAGLLRDLKRAHAAGAIEFTPGGLMMLGDCGMNFSGVYHTEVRKHESVLRAIEDGDPERELWARAQVLAAGDNRSGRGYVPVDVSDDHNLIPTGGRNFLLNLLFRSATAKISTWYFGPFTTSWTPAATAHSGWAGPTNNLATELTDAQFTGSARQAATFGTNAAASVIATSAVTAITLETGVSALTLYGATLNEISTIAYDAQDKVLLSAAAYSSAKSGLAAADVINLGYELTASST